MKRFTFYSQHSYSDLRPVIPVTLHAPNGVNPSVFAVLDSGAVQSVFQVSIAGLMGVDDVTTGEPVTLRMANGQDALAYSFPAEATILGHRIQFALAFCPDIPQSLPNILGVKDVFHKIVFGIEHGQQTVYA